MNCVGIFWIIIKDRCRLPIICSFCMKRINLIIMEDLKIIQEVLKGSMIIMCLKSKLR